MSNFEEFKKQYPVIVELPVLWGDMDAFNHVNNVIYFRWFESARICYFEEIGLMEKMQVEQLGPILANADIRFKAAVTYPDTIWVGAKTSEINEKHLIHEHAVFSESLGFVTTTGSGRCVLFDYNSQKKVAMTEDIITAIQKLEQSG